MKIFITGIGTDVGKTIISAVFTEALEADYWKPIQAGSLNFTDTDFVRSLISNSISKFHKEAFLLNQPMSPHAAAAIDGIKVDIEKINIPPFNKHLIIEGAGGLLVPLNNEVTVADLIKKIDCNVVLVSRNYLGSINHTLLTVQELKNRKIPILGIVFNGNENRDTESIIEKMSGCKIIGRIQEEVEINKETIKHYSKMFSFKIQEISNELSGKG